MDIMEKLTILADSAKYDVACTAGSNLSKKQENANFSGCICHSYSADGRCISLLKVLFSNACIYDCVYCVNRRSNDVKRACFTPKEIAELTMEFYKRNYIDGLFLSSAVIKSPDYTMEQMIKSLEIVRNEHKFRGYIHAKTIPGASEELVTKLGHLADRISVNIELPSEQSLKRLAPEKTKNSILKPMRQMSLCLDENKRELVKYKHSTRFAPAGQTTQMIIGASGETDYQILKLTQGLYNKYMLKRVFYSAYIPVLQNAVLPDINTKPPLLREHRLYQADWLLRFYSFTADEILSESNQNFNPHLDPKCNWAIHNMHFFPIDVNKASYEGLLRVPGIGIISAKRICVARKHTKLRIEDLKRIGVVIKRAQYFIACEGFLCPTICKRETTVKALLDEKVFCIGHEQTSMETILINKNNIKTLTLKENSNNIALKEEAIKCIVAKM